MLIIVWLDYLLKFFYSTSCHTVQFPSCVDTTVLTIQYTNPMASLQSQHRSAFFNTKADKSSCVWKTTVICVSKIIIVKWPHSLGMNQRNHLHFKLHLVLDKKCYEYCHSCNTQFARKNQDALNSDEEKGVQYTSQQQ